jgi:hypothetical protein
MLTRQQHGRQAHHRRFEFAGLATDPYGNVRAAYEGTASLNRPRAQPSNDTTNV